jgi:hypothetical protein
MLDEFNEFNQLIKQIQETPHLAPPEQLTQNVMRRLNTAQEKHGVLWMLRQTIAKTNQMSFSRFSIDGSSLQTSGFYFLLAGLFFFIIGATLLNSLFFISSISGTVILIIIQSVLVLTASISLVAPGMMLAVNIPDADRFAKRAVMVFAILIMANALFMNETIKTTAGEVMTLAFVAAGIVTGIILMKSLKNRMPETNNTLTGGLHNAQG